MSTNLAVNDSASYQLIPEASAGELSGQSGANAESASNDDAPSSAAPGFDFDCNVFAILTMAIAEMSNSDMALTTVQSEGILQNTQVEASVSAASEAELQSLSDQMNEIVKNQGWTDPSNGSFYKISSSECQSEMSALNTEFSTEMQEGNMNTQMVQANVQEGESEIQMTEDALKSCSQLFNLPNQILSYVSNLIAASPL